jgi:hypothetical protein
MQRAHRGADAAAAAAAAATVAPLLQLKRAARKAEKLVRFSARWSCMSVRWQPRSWRSRATRLSSPRC